MKKTLLVLAALAAFAALADKFLFSADGVTQGCTPRELPSQGVSLTTHKVVVGLHALDDLARKDCGWYRLIETQKPDTNHYWRCTNYIFNANGTASKVWSEYTPPARPVQYSKYAIIEKLEQMPGTTAANKWIEVKAAIESQGYLDKWNACTYITGDNPVFVAAKPQIAALMGMTVKELDDLLATCKY